MTHSQKKSDTRGNGRQSLSLGKRPQGITKHQTLTATRKSARLEYHQKRAGSTNQSARRHPFPSPSSSNTRRKENSPIGSKVIGTVGKRKRLERSSCEGTSLQEAQCRQPEPKKRKSEQANPYTSSLEGKNSQLNKGQPELSVSANPDQELSQNRKRLQKAEIPLPQTRANPSRKQPSVSTGNLHKQLSKRKRRRAILKRSCLEETNNRYLERCQVLRQTSQHADTDTYDPVAHWTCTFHWPKDLGQRGLRMSEKLSTKRRSESSHRSQTLERMATHGVFMQTSNLIRKGSEAFCEKYLEGNRKTVESSIFTAEQFSEVLKRVQNLNEARIQRDVAPWVVPSAETLFLRGKLKIGYIGEELNAEWIRCATMGSTRPKPDFTVGLLPTAFTEEEIGKLENYAQPTKPFRFTPYLSFPFLVCEAKTGEEGLNKADRQNIHSASIAVRAIIMLYREAFGHASDCVLQLHGEVLVFSVSHDNDRIFIYGHFAVAEADFPEGLKYYRYPIVILSFTTRGGADMYKAYNFIMNVYEDFAPVHRKRIKDAVEKLPRPSEKTGLSFATSDMFLNESDSQEMLQGKSAFGTPSKPASSSQKKEMATIREQLERQRKESEQDIGRQRRENTELKEQLKQDREQSKQEMGKLKDQNERLLSMLDQERERSKQDMDEMKGQLSRLMDIIKPQIS